MQKEQREEALAILEEALSTGAGDVVDRAKAKALKADLLPSTTSIAFPNQLRWTRR
jgi:hypothetical protein